MKVLIVEDDAVLCKLLEKSIAKQFDAYSVTSPQAAMALLEKTEVDTIVSDIRMPGMTGVELLERVKAHAPDTQVILMTGFGTVEESVAAMKKGAHDYILKPVDVDILLKKLEDIRERIDLRSRVLNAAAGKRMVFSGRKMQALTELAERAAMTDTNVLVTGETGTGKEVLSRFIHDVSPRKRGPFVAVNCCAIPENLFESELFGFKRGAFTGADRSKKGVVATADRGTLFLDEIGDMPLVMQPKFLRFLETKSFYPIGAEQPESADIRVIAATNRDLGAMVAAGEFRQDLYYRLNVVTLSIPPLRERTEDVAPLTDFFLNKFQHINPKVRGIREDALASLMNYPFPGNIRELENIIERGMILERDELLGPASVTSCGVHPRAQAEKLDDVIRDHILTVLDSCEWNRARAAEILGIDVSTIYRKLKEYGRA